MRRLFTTLTAIFMLPAGFATATEFSINTYKSGDLEFYRANGDVVSGSNTGTVDICFKPASPANCFNLAASNAYGGEQQCATEALHAEALARIYEKTKKPFSTGKIPTSVLVEDLAGLPALYARNTKGTDIYAALIYCGDKDGYFNNRFALVIDLEGFRDHKWFEPEAIIAVSITNYEKVSPGEYNAVDPD